MAVGTADNLIPRASARALFNAAAEPKWWVEVAGGHNGVLDGAEFEQALGSLLRHELGCTKGASASSSPTPAPR